MFQIASWISYLWDTNLSRPHFNSKSRSSLREKTQVYQGHIAEIRGYWGRWNTTALNCPYISSVCGAELSPIVHCLSPTWSCALFPAAENPRGLIWQPEQEMSDTQGLWADVMHNNISQIHNLGRNMHVRGIKAWLFEPIEPPLQFNYL